MLNQRLEVCIPHIRRDCISEKGWLKKARQCVNISIPKQAFVGLGLRGAGKPGPFQEVLSIENDSRKCLRGKGNCGKVREVEL